MRDDLGGFGLGGGAFLGANAYQGTISIKTPTVDLYPASGSTKLTAYIRAGEYIIDPTMTDDPLYIAGTEYDVDSATMTLTIGETFWEYTNRVSRKGSMKGAGRHVDAPPGRRP